MTPINIIMIIVIIASISVVLKKYVKEYSLLINILTGLVVIVYLISETVPIFNYIKELINLTKIPDKHISILFKSLGLCFVTQFASDSCRDSGEISLASKIEIIGKIAMLTISMPLFEEVTDIALEFVRVK